MYWHNPIIETSLNSERDLLRSMSGPHCLFYAPAVPVDQIQCLVTLQQTCDLVNAWIASPESIEEPGDIDKILNAVRINQYVHSLRRVGNIKPMLLHYTGQWPLQSATGGSRLMAAERCPTITGFPAFISTHNRYRNRFLQWEEITSLAQFADHVGADADTKFYFRFTDNDADYGIDWYEAALASTDVPNNDQCRHMLQAYLQTKPKDFTISPEWFDQEIDWTTLGHH